MRKRRALTFAALIVLALLGAGMLLSKYGLGVTRLELGLEGLPEGCTLLGPEVTAASLFRELCMANLERYADAGSGVCRFTTQEFISLLKFCGVKPLMFSGMSGNSMPGRRVPSSSMA